ncbi:AT-rich interactive domain-containing protein 1A [Drosophila rhopaloa]|uniref:Trithorax group protein osa n=1 Tax=Drosophila rhopaloa TaxID=1041015 RepID=A0ABM5HQ51_DRORH|nr:AT-rich interactive domain-containing protein 1A [Drosophila rhopaloa]
METFPKSFKMLFLWSCLIIGLSVPASATGAGEVSRHRSKRTMTTICVEIRPSSPKDEPYYMCRGANFADGNGQQGCVEVRHQGGEGEPFYMCRGAESTVPGNENRPSPEISPPINPPPTVQHDSVHNFQLLPAFGGGSYAQQAIPEGSIHQDQSARPTPYQEEPHQQPPPQQHQPHAQYGFYGHPMAAHPAASPAQSSGVPELSHPIVGSPPATPTGVSSGPGPAATPPTHDPAAYSRSSSRPKDHEIVGSSRDRFRFEDDFKRDDLNQQYRKPVNQPLPQDQLMWVPLSHTEDPENDPVMRAFYGSLSGAGSPAQKALAAAGNKEELVPQATVPVDPMVGQIASGYSPYNIQYPEVPAPPTLPPPPPTYPQSEVSPPPNPYCSGCSASPPPFQCPTQPDNGVSYSTSCPSFQPVIISMPCYGQRQPAPYFALPRTPAGILRGQPMATPFGLAPAPVGSPLGGGFGMAGQFGNPFGMNPQMGGQGFDMEHQVGGPFGMGMQFGMGLNPFGPFGALNPFNPFNRMLGAPAHNVAAPNGNFFQRVFNFNQGDENTSTTEAAPYPEAQSERSGKLNFSSSTTEPATSEQSDSIVRIAHERVEDEDSAEDMDRDDDQAETTPLPASDADVSDDGAGIQELVSKAAELLKPDKRKRHNTRSSGRIAQKHRYLQQL